MGVMELRVQSSEGCSMPPGCYIGVRIGDVLKQGRYEPQRCYNFEQVDRRKNAKIDLYQHVGSCFVPVDPEVKSEHEVSITTTDPAFTGLRLKVNSSCKGPADPVKPPRAERVSAMKSKAKDYLLRHSIEEKLSEAVKSLLKDQPDDPTEYLCRHLRGSLGDADDRPPAAAAQQPGARALEQPVARELTPQASVGTRPAAISPFAGYYKDHFRSLDLMQAQRLFPAATRLAPSRSEAPQEVGFLRSKACEVLLNATEDGNLFSILAELRNEGPGAAQASAQASLGPRPADVTPFAAYYRAHFNLPPPEASSGSGPAAVLPFAGYYKAHFTCLDMTQALTHFPSARPARAGAVAPQQVESLREKACQLLLNSTEDGNLLNVLSEITGQREQVAGPAAQKSAPAGMGDLRQKACEALVKASADGNLMKTLEEVRNGQEAGQADIGELRKQAASVLMKASDNGQLESTLKDICLEGAGEKAALQVSPGPRPADVTPFAAYYKAHFVVPPPQTVPAGPRPEAITPFAAYYKAHFTFSQP